LSETFSNEISEVEDENASGFKNTVTTVFLGNNDLGEVPAKFFGSFKRLVWLNLVALSQTFYDSKLRVFVIS